MTKQERTKVKELLSKIKKSGYSSDIAFMCGVFAFEKNNVGNEIATLDEMIALLDKNLTEDAFFKEITKKFKFD